MTQIITETLVDHAVAWLNEAHDHVAAKRVAVMRAMNAIKRLEKAEKRIIAKLCRSGDGSVEARKWAAIVNEETVAIEEQLAAAEDEYAVRVGEWEYVLDQREKCKMIIEAWRTASANNRGVRF